MSQDLIVTPTVAIIILLIVVVLCIVLTIYINPSNYDHSSAKVFMTCLTGLGIFITFMFYYSIVSLQQQEQRLAIIQESARFSDTVINSLLKTIRKSIDNIPGFVNSILPLTKCRDIDAEDPVNVKTCAEKFVLSYTIFTVWQDSLISNAFFDIDTVSYIATFLQFATSKQLYEQWCNIKVDFNYHTQSFGDALFNKAKDISNNPDAYQKAAEEFIKIFNCDCK